MWESNSFSYWTGARTVIRLSSAKEKIKARGHVTKFHSHPAHELIMVKSGSVIVHLENREYIVKEGSFFAVPSSTVHDVLFPETQCCFYNIMFRGKLFPKLKLNVFPCSGKEFAAAEELIRVCSRNFTPMRGELSASLLTTLLCMMEDRLEEEFPEEKHLPVNRLMFYTSLVSDAIEYLEKHFPEKITLGQTASSVGISSSYLRSLLLKETGKSFSQHLLMIRISHACRLLESSPENIKSIAQECGFNSLSFFYRSFKRYTGITPLEYARSLS